MRVFWGWGKICEICVCILFQSCQNVKSIQVKKWASFFCLSQLFSKNATPQIFGWVLDTLLYNSRFVCFTKYMFISVIVQIISDCNNKFKIKSFSIYCSVLTFLSRNITFYILYPYSILYSYPQKTLEKREVQKQTNDMEWVKNKRKIETNLPVIIMVSHESILLRDKSHFNFRIKTLILKNFKFINLTDKSSKEQ